MEPRLTSARKKKPIFRKYLGKLIAFFGNDSWKPIIGSFASLLAIIGFLFTPLKDHLYHFIWNEEAIININLSTVSNIIRGKEFSLETAVYTKSSIPLTKGTLSIIDPMNAFEVLEGKKLFESPPIEVSKILPDTGKLLLRPITLGNFPIISELKTKYSTFRDTVMIHVYDIGKPTLYNWSGKWPIKIGPYRGVMYLTEDQSGGDVTIGGKYYLFEIGDTTKVSEKGSINGVRDNKFDVEFRRDDKIRDNKKKIWDVLCLPAKFNPSNHYIELTGTATLIQYNKHNWAQEKTLPFSSYTKVD